jgi:hypothetical protein
VFVVSPAWLVILETLDLLYLEYIKGERKESGGEREKTGTKKLQWMP